ncbi:activator-dependent family glycosyltransferase [Micromonospora sp. CA-269861]|uniref:activator-dependent family glycosyltransferase n=1 Tax=Micromonospora sp. CA-269861 TaxID=3239968 RepID=UPI003D91746C
MRVLFATYAETTHYYNMVPLAWALRTAGHEVRVATQPALMDAVVQSGLTAVQVGEDHDFMSVIAAKADDLTWGERITTALRTGGADMDYPALLAFFDEAVETSAKVFNDPMVDALVAYAREWQPDLIIWENFTLAGAIAARVTGAAHARLLWGADAQTRIYNRFQALLAEQPEDRRRDPMRDWATAHLERFGVTYDADVLTGQHTLDQAPQSMRLDVGLRTVPFRYVPYNGPARVPGWLRERPERPRICVTAGISMRYMLGYDPIPVSTLKLFADADVEVVATLAVDESELADVPPNVRVVDFVPMHALLPSCAAVVHIGSAGVVSTAMAYGVPQLTLVPDLWDAVVRADMLREQGAGLDLTLDRATPEAIRDNVLRLVREPEFRAAADRIRGEMLAEPAPSEIVPVLEKIAAQR